MHTTGLRYDVPRTHDWRVGSTSPLIFNIIRDDGQWDDFLPEHEMQISKHFDSKACVTFSALNQIEILHKALYQEIYNGSDRAIAKLSGTTKEGNWLYRVADTIREYGIPSESIYPYPRMQDGFDWDDFYKEVDLEVINDGKEYKKKYQLNYEFVPMVGADSIVEALKYTPLQVIGAYPSTQNAINGIIPQRSAMIDHAFTIYGYDKGNYFKVLDHYTEQKKKVAWDYIFGTYALRFKLAKNNEITMPIKIENNTLIQLVEGEGRFGFYLDGYIIVDELAKILATDRMRNRDGRTRSLTLKDWNAFTKKNLKNEVL